MSFDVEFLGFGGLDSSGVVGLFVDSFTDSEGEAEGLEIGGLVSDLISMTDESDIRWFVAVSWGVIIGAVIFSRFMLSNDMEAFLLSPVTVATEFQGFGVGLGLIGYGIEQMRLLGVELVFTYGDPSFYSKVGFEWISEDVVRAPHELSQPEGWLALSVNGRSIDMVGVTSRCVGALDSSRYW